MIKAGWIRRFGARPAGITSVEAVEAAIDNQLAPKLREKNKKLLKKTYEVVKEGL